MDKQGASFSGIPGLGLLGNPPKRANMPPVAQAEKPVPIEQPASDEHRAQSAEDGKPSNIQAQSGPATTQGAIIPGLSLPSSAPMENIKEEAKNESPPHSPPYSPPYSPSLFGKLEASLAQATQHAVKKDERTEESVMDAAMAGDNTATASGQDAVSSQNATDTTMLDAPRGDPEFEADSSPYESSSDDSSDDSSSEDDEPYVLLTPDEQIKILMNGDCDSDDDRAAKKGGGQVRTKNEVPEEPITKPDITITPEMKIVELGAVESVVENTVLIMAKTSGEYQVLETNSVLCLEDRSVIGVVSDTLGPVQQPLYCVRFTYPTEIAAAGIAVGTKVFYCEQHSTYVFTQALKGKKGTDASNIWDEEVAEDELDFSDDELEIEHKRRIKAQRMGRRDGQSRTGDRGGHSSNKYQDNRGKQHGNSEHDDLDGPYKTLTRPASFAENVMRPEAPLEDESGRSHHQGHYNNGAANTGRGGGRGRGRGDRGGRGRGRGYDRGGHSGGYSVPPRTQGGMTPSSTAPFNSQIGFGFDQAIQQPQQVFPPMQQSWGQSYTPSATTGPQFFFAGGQQQQQQQWPQQVNPGVDPAQLPSGAFFNPAFFGAAPQAQSQNQTQHSQQPWGSPPQNPPQDGQSRQ